MGWVNGQGVRRTMKRQEAFLQLLRMQRSQKGHEESPRARTWAQNSVVSSGAALITCITLWHGYDIKCRHAGIGHDPCNARLSEPSVWLRGVFGGYHLEPSTLVNGFPRLSNAMRECASCRTVGDCLAATIMTYKSSDLSGATIQYSRDRARSTGRACGRRGYLPLTESPSKLFE